MTATLTQWKPMLFHAILRGCAAALTHGEQVLKERAFGIGFTRKFKSLQSVSIQAIMAARRPAVSEGA